MDNIFTYENDRFIIYGARIDESNLKYSLGIRSKINEFDDLKSIATKYQGCHDNFDTILASDGDIRYNKHDGQYYVFIAPCWYNFSDMAHIKRKIKKKEEKKIIQYDEKWVKYATELADLCKSQWITTDSLTL